MTDQSRTQHQLFPKGLEDIPILSPINSSWQFTRPHDYYMGENILKLALLAACKRHFKKSHSKTKKFQITLRPEPTNLCYYYNSDGKERLVVLSQDNLRNTLSAIFQEIITKLNTKSPTEVFESGSLELERRIFSQELNKMELTIAQEKSYMTKIFQTRYEAVGEHNRTQNNSELETNTMKIPDRIKNKMRVLSFLKYIKALNAALYSVGKFEEKFDYEHIERFLEEEPEVTGLNRALLKNNLTSILDCGCGTNGPEFFKNFQDVSYTGLDLIQITPNRIVNKYMKVIRSDIEEPPKAVRKNDYSLILGINLLETTTRPWRAIHQLANLLKADGICVLVFNQYEGSFLITGNPFTLKSLMKYCRTILIPLTGEVFVALDSPTGRDYLLVFRKKRGTEESQGNAKLIFSDPKSDKLGAPIARLEFE